MDSSIGSSSEVLEATIVPKNIVAFAPQTDHVITMVEKQPTIMSQEVPSTTEVVIPPKVQSEPAIVILECPPENAHDDSTEGDMHSVCIEHDQHIDSNNNCSLKDRNLERDKDSFDDELSNSDDDIIVPFAQGKINHDKEDNADMLLQLQE
jgi:hypothetical protein